MKRSAIEEEGNDHALRRWMCVCIPGAAVDQGCCLFYFLFLISYYYFVYIQYPNH